MKELKIGQRWELSAGCAAGLANKDRTLTVEAITSDGYAVLVRPGERPQVRTEWELRTSWVLLPTIRHQQWMNVYADGIGGTGYTDANWAKMNRTRTAVGVMRFDFYDDGTVETEMEAP